MTKRQPFCFQILQLYPTLLQQNALFSLTFRQISFISKMSSISITNFGLLNKLNNLFEKWYAHILMMHLHNISISWVNLQMETNIFYCLPHFNSLYKNRWIKFAVEIFNSLFAWFMSYSNGLKVKFWKKSLRIWMLLDNRIFEQ